MSASVLKTPLSELAFELRLFIGREVNWNNEFERFIAGCRPGRLDFEGRPVSVASLELSLAECRKQTERLAEIYHLVSALAAHEAEAQALLARLSEQTKPGTPAAA